jgi:DNA-binding helix-hairpin-helix protein with protein kinase domain
MNILKPNQNVIAESSRTACTIEHFLGGGGQGEVFRANLSGHPVALKWYYPSQATSPQRTALELLVKKGPPNDRFLWPMDMASADGVPGFGYIMPLRDPGYRGIVDMMKRRVEPSFRALATAGFELADSFFQLHAKGLCYRDISFGNVFLHPDSGHITVCDNDNVTVDGIGGSGILGTPRFMAPEVVRGEASPSSQTDLFSLSVLLFYIYMMHHPLEGRRESVIRSFDLPAMTKLYGIEPLFIFDPDDRSNEPIPGYHDNAITFWPIYPQFLRDLFIRAFTNGIRDPLNGRVRETEWRGAMIKLRDSIVYCAGCGSDNFYCADGMKATGGQPGPCWSCRKQIRLPARIRVGNNIVMLNHDTRIFPHHIDSGRLFDFLSPVAEMVQHPQNPAIWGIKNLSKEKWVVTTAEGKVSDVEPGRSLTLAVGTRINFGKSEGEIRV